jgi:hypothetical protein
MGKQATVNTQPLKIDHRRLIMRYHEMTPTERAIEAKELAQQAVAEWRQKNLPTYTPTVIRDLEGVEDAE